MPIPFFVLYFTLVREICIRKKSIHQSTTFGFIQQDFNGWNGTYMEHVVSFTEWVDACTNIDIWYPYRIMRGDPWKEWLKRKHPYPLGYFLWIVSYLIEIVRTIHALRVFLGIIPPYHHTTIRTRGHGSPNSCEQVILQISCVTMRNGRIVHRIKDDGSSHMLEFDLRGK